MSEQRYHEENPVQAPPRRAASRQGGGVVEFLVILLVSFALVFGFVRPFVVEAFYIPSESMVPTLLVGDRVLVNKFIYRFSDPDPGDVVVFRSVNAGEGALPVENGPITSIRRTFGLEEDPADDLIKRVVGVEGDRISVERGKLFVNGERQTEPYVNERFLRTQAPYGPRKVPENHVFAMGDNRANSQDSRVFGPVPEENVQGEAFLRFWPPRRIGGL